MAVLLAGSTAWGFGGRDRLEIGQLGEGGPGAVPGSSQTKADSHGRGHGEASPATAAGGGASESAGLRRLLWEIEKRTSIEVQPEAVPVRIGDATELHRHPLLYWAGDRAFPMPSDDELARLRRHLVMGGMLILDSAEGRAGGGFDQSVRALVAKLFPNQQLSRLPEDHVLYRSFYLLRVPAGRVIAQPYLEAVLIGGNGGGGSGGGGSGGSDDSAGGTSSQGSAAGSGQTSSPGRNGRALIVYSQNDLGGAWARDRFGQWQHEVVPGGEPQREQAFRLGVNLVMYALCLDYKSDQVHVPFIMRRRVWQAPLPKINLEIPPTPSPGGSGGGGSSGNQAP